MTTVIKLKNMKNSIIILLITFLIGFTSFSQHKIVKINGKEYYKDSRLNNYIGEWKFINNESQFKIDFIPRRIATGKYIFDLLKGYYLFSKNDKEIANTILTMNPNDPNEKKSSAFMENDEDEILLIKFWDASFKKYGTARLTFLNPEKTKVKWVLGPYEREQINIITDVTTYKEPPEGYSVPKEMILEKVVKN